MKRIILLVLVLVCGAAYADPDPEVLDAVDAAVPDPEVLDAVDAAVPDPEILDAVDAAVTVANNQGLEYDLTYMYDGVVVVYTFAKKKPVTLGMRFFLREGDLYISSVLEAEGLSATKRGPKRAEKKFYKGLQEENERRGNRCCYGVPDFDIVLFGAMKMLNEEPK